MLMKLRDQVMNCVQNYFNLTLLTCTRKARIETKNDHRIESSLRSSETRLKKMKIYAFYLHKLHVRRRGTSFSRLIWILEYI